MYNKECNEFILEQNKQLRLQRKYYRRLHIDNLYPVDVDEYYESLKDWSEFKVPKNTSKQDAEKDSQITHILKIRAIFSNKAKKELEKKQKNAKLLQYKYEQDYQKRVNRKRFQFDENQRKNHKLVDDMKSKFMKGDEEQIMEFFNIVLQNDDFTLDAQNYYDPAGKVLRYDAETKMLSYRYRLPDKEEICVIDKFIYDEDSGEILQKNFDGINATKIRIYLIERLLLRSVAMIMCSDKYNYVSAVNLTGFLNYYDSAYGNYRELNVAKLQISKDLFSQINLERVNVSKLFKRVINEQFHISLGLYEKEPYELSEIK